MQQVFLGQSDHLYSVDQCMQNMPVSRCDRLEAPAGHAASQRFRTAACWLRALLEPSNEPDRQVPHDVLFPLQRTVYPRGSRPVFPTSPFHVEFDASPWGGGAALRRGNTFVAYFEIDWDDQILSLFNAQLGDSRFQSLWEFVTLLLSLIVWREYAASTTLFILGDNISALQDAIKLNGKGLMLVVAREIAWRQAKWPLNFDCMHLPKERNVVADALSRRSAQPPQGLPECLRFTPRVFAPPWGEVWRAWEAGRG